MHELYRYIPTGARIKVISNGVITPEYETQKSSLDVGRELNLDKDAYLIGSIGRISEEKGLDFLVEMLGKMECSKARLLVIGNSEGIGELQRDIEERGMGSQVHFLGHRTDVKELLGNLSILVQASRLEGMPMTVLEAMAVGCRLSRHELGRSLK